jgi:hypothetical protein
MKSRSLLLPLTILFLILLGGNVVVAALLLFHAPEWFASNLTLVIVLWSLFYLLQLMAPLVQVRTRIGQVPSRSMERLQWNAYAAMGILSTMFIMALALEICARIASLIWLDSQQAMIDGWWFYTMLVMTVLTTVLGIYQATKGLQVKTVEVILEHLPVAFDGYRIAQISDLHVSSLIGKRYTQMVVDRVNALEPNLIVMTGDFVDGAVEPLRYRVAPLGTLNAPDGRYFITGNHEYYYGAESWVAEHRRLGTTVLLNEHRLIKNGDAEIVLAGVTDKAGGAFIPEHRQDIAKALLGSPDGAVKILLAHQPGCYEDASANGVDLQLSGHTHGGQFFPWQFAVKLVHRYSQGLYRHGKMWIYVNPGTGFWGPPLRATVPPEITVLVLKRKI